MRFLAGLPAVYGAVDIEFYGGLLDYSGRKVDARFGVLRPAWRQIRLFGLLQPFLRLYGGTCQKNRFHLPC